VNELESELEAGLDSGLNDHDDEFSYTGVLLNMSVKQNAQVLVS
jgi:hypothetical protein